MTEKYDIEIPGGEAEIAALLVGRSIDGAEGNLLTLDDGTTLKVLPNKGCGGCSNGWYELKAIADEWNVITDVECVQRSLSDTEYGYEIFVVADDVRRRIVCVEGDDGNGYYGTGYRLVVTRIDKKEER